MDQTNTAVTSIYGIFMSNLASPSGLDHNARVYNNTSLIGGTGSATLSSSLTVYSRRFGCSFSNSPSTATYYNNVCMNLREGTANSVHTGLYYAPHSVLTVSDYNTCLQTESQEPLDANENWHMVVSSTTTFGGEILLWWNGNSECIL